MEELLELLFKFFQQIEGDFNTLSDSESQEVANFLKETMSFITENINQPMRISQVQSALPQGTDLLWILSGEDPNRFVNYLRTYPGEGFQELISNPTKLANVIARLQEQNPGQEPGIASDGIPNTDFPSSNVAGMKYDPQTGKLLVKFHGERKEPIYQYDGVPPQIFQLLKHGNAIAQTKGKNQWGEWWPGKSPSIGRGVVDYLIKSGYNYRRLN